MAKRLERPYFVTNTKMFKTAAETEAFLSRLAELTGDLKDEITLFTIPSYTSITAAVSASAGSGIMVGAQSIGFEERGQYTGEISPLMLKEAGASLVMIGHSERRHVFHETDFDEEKRVKCAVKQGFTTLLCVGETAEQKEYGISKEALALQLKIGLHSITPEQAKEQLWIAYEPVWAIGVNGVPADEGYANEMHGAIKATLCEIFGDEIGSDIPVFYGGSVNNGNAVPLIRQPNIDGLFIGRSAWDADNFNTIIRDALPEFKARKK